MRKMRVTAEITAISFTLGIAAVASFGGCGSSGANGSGTGGAGGAGNASSTVASASHSSSHATAVAPTSGSMMTTGPCVDNGDCDLAGGEDCTCKDCQPTAACIPDQCVTDGMCTFDDACICVDCWMDSFCGDPTQSNCEDDGMCDSFVEGCLCNDCKDKMQCAGFPGASGSASSTSASGAGGGSSSSASGAGGGSSSASGAGGGTSASSTSASGADAGP